MCVVERRGVTVSREAETNVRAECAKRGVSKKENLNPPQPNPKLTPNTRSNTHYATPPLSLRLTRSAGTPRRSGVGVARRRGGVGGNTALPRPTARPRPTPTLGAKADGVEQPEAGKGGERDGGGNGNDAESPSAGGAGKASSRLARPSPELVVDARRGLDTGVGEEGVGVGEEETSGEGEGVSGRGSARRYGCPTYLNPYPPYPPFECAGREGKGGAGIGRAGGGRGGEPGMRRVRRGGKREREGEGEREARHDLEAGFVEWVCVPIYIRIRIHPQRVGGVEILARPAPPTPRQNRTQPLLERRLGDGAERRGWVRVGFAGGGRVRGGIGRGHRGGDGVAEEHEDVDDADGEASENDARVDSRRLCAAYWLGRDGVERENACGRGCGRGDARSYCATSARYGTNAGSSASTSAVVYSDAEDDADVDARRNSGMRYSGELGRGVGDADAEERRTNADARLVNFLRSVRTPRAAPFCSSRAFESALLLRWDGAERKGGRGRGSGESRAAETRLPNSRRENGGARADGDEGRAKAMVVVVVGVEKKEGKNAEREGSRLILLCP
ncbi:hypothetical protein DFH06DRAFT_1420992 [Mycena polygramma]|nr:hypothetical protein DFH06DRAFT_1420992 [Mycena polygramma]